MMNLEHIVSLLNQFTPEIKGRFGVKSLRIFGSYARQSQKSDSDVDLFVDMSPKAYDFLSLHEYLQELLNMKVDLVRNHQSIDPFLLNEIKRDGLTIF